MSGKSWWSQSVRDHENRSVVYRFFSTNGELLYVGVSLSVFQRIMSHRTKNWHKDIANVTLEHFSDRREAMDAEAAAIREHQPRYNTVHTNRAPKPVGRHRAADQGEKK